jgi:hypothetical protein
LGLNVENIAEQFTAYDLLEVKADDDEIDYEKVCEILTQKKPFNTITLNDEISEGEEKVKFEAVVGNPPYNEDTNGDSTGTNPIYHHFINISQKISPINVLITPARFLFNAGKTPKAWNKKMLNDEHFKIAYYKQNPDKVFAGIPITGGVAISYWNKNEKYEPIGTFIPYEELQTIIETVKQKDTFKNITEIIYVHSKFDLEKMYEINPAYKNLIGSEGRDRRVRANAFEVFDFFTEMPTCDEDIRVLGLYENKRTYRYVHPKYLEPCDWVNKYKVFVPESNGASGMLGEESARIISRPAMGSANDGVTQTFIVVGAFDTQAESNNLHKYILTKFSRLLLGSLKATQRNNSSTWANVPLQDFTENSDIDWTKSIAEIDQQLYAKYGLTQEEIDFIETMIKPMGD